MSRFYVTTPIYYVNALPHLGTFYTTVVADALARYHRARARSRGEDPAQSVFFLTGLDEHGQKIERIARERGMDPQAYCDEIAAKFQQTWREIGISNDAFVRTTRNAETRDHQVIKNHPAAVAEMWQRIAAGKAPNGEPNIFAAEYDGMYCVGCEDSKTEDDVVVDGDRKLCKIHLTPVERVKEKNYFFRLSAYADKLLAWYETGAVRPESRLNEVRSFVKGGLRDLSISRTAVKWGLPVPGDPSHTIYVWIDALTNYLTALGGPEAVARGEGRGAFWADSHHLIAKDILRHHAVYWPALLMGAGLPPPKQIFCHGYLTVKGQKISKSMPATRVDPKAIAEGLGVDPLRYFVLREYTLGGDGDFTYESLFQRHQSDLGNDLGNLAESDAVHGPPLRRRRAARASRRYRTWRLPTLDRRDSRRRSRVGCCRWPSRPGSRSILRCAGRLPGGSCAPTTDGSTKRSHGCCTKTANMTRLLDVLAAAARRCAGRH